MSLPAPNLDDRRFQDLVDDAKRLIQRRCPEWTDHNVSDPGVTLIEAFATMVDQLLYRLNRVPERHYLRFLELVGLRLFPPTAARTDLTFWLSSPQPETIQVRAGTQVATSRGEGDELIVFTTSSDLDIVPCELARVATSTSDDAPLDRTDQLQDRQVFPCFGDSPAVGDALYVGLSAATPSCAVLLRWDCQVHGIGVDPTDPPLRWEAWNGDEWIPCEVDRDETGGLNRPGDLVLHVPPGHQPTVLRQHRAGWLRCVLTEAEPGQATYSSPPLINSLFAATIGGTTSALHAEPVDQEELGRSDGSAGQVFPVRRTPVVDSGTQEVLEVGDDSGWQIWTQVENFAESTEADHHFVFDRHRGEVLLGPAARLADGSVRRYGAVPPKGAVLRLRQYHTGGGAAGNVAANSLRVPKTSVPYITSTTNRQPAEGGVDGETMAEAVIRGPLELRSRDRAVAASDYEMLARRAAPELGRVHCVPARPGATDGSEINVVRLLVVPAITHDPSLQLEMIRLRPPEEVLRRVAEYLEPRRVLGTRLLIEPPYYRGITVVAKLTAQTDAARGRLRNAALAALYEYLDPLAGGPRGRGWPLGTAVRIGDLHARLGRVDGLESVEDLRLFAADPVLGARDATPLQRLELGPTELPFSFEHQVVVQ
ncbi:putative baseplate assembly protein [Kribbella sp. CA-253562]|uniref:putative baseplate assembly protein n=1 Tax=Kribbella sp. CA-253562 TaxID=3239942 RepID=UPI003D8CE027